MKTFAQLFLTAGSLLAFTALLAQAQQQPGHSLGKVTVQGDLILLTLDQDVLGKAKLFNLDHRTLRFTPDNSSKDGSNRYRVENLPLQWDAEFGPEATAQVSLKNFAFPFSGKTWNSISVGVTGSMTFVEPEPAGEAAGRGGAGRGGRGAGGGRAGAGRGGAGGGGGRGGGLSIARFDELATAGHTLINTVPAISVFFKPRMSGTRYEKELDDRAVITWSLTEPVGGVQDMYWKPTINRFQAVLHKDGVIEMSYNDVNAQDAIVGIYPMVTAGAETEIATLTGRENIKSIKLSAVDGLFLKAVIQTSGTISPLYRICLQSTKPKADCAADTPADAVWTIPTGRGGGRGAQAAKVEGDTITFQSTLPAGYKPGAQIFISASTQGGSVAAQAVKLTGISSPELDLATVKKEDGPFAVAFEAFHYMKPPRAADLTCSVIKALGDKFDMLAYYSDFRIDNPEAGTSSTGPLGGGPNGGAVTGIGANQRGLENYCTQGRFQWQFIQPVWVGANQMQEYPPEDATDPSTHDIIAYSHQLSERTSNGKMPPYDYAMSQIGHEMGHRWSAFVSAKVGAETIVLGPTHWARGLQAPVAFPYQRPTEASAMGGGVWQDNYDGTFTQLDDDYYVPATGWSYLDLYLMGMIAPSEVPDFFILRNPDDQPGQPPRPLVQTGKDANGHPIFKAARTKVTIEDVIAVEGPRLPDVDHAQKKFNTGMVMVVEHGKTPSKELIERTTGIRARWMDYWETTTGHRSSMTANPK